MKNLKKRILTVFLMFAMVIASIPMSQVSANTVLIMNSSANARHAPTINGWNIEAWTDTRLTGQSTMTVNTNGGAFTCEWNNTYNTLFRTGRKFSPMPAASTFTSSSGRASVRYDVRNFSSANGATYLCMYGWTDGTTGNNTTGGAIIEWYVVDSWMHWNPERAGTSGTYQRHGTTVIGGQTYDIISAWRINQPWVGPGNNGTFLQLFNVRRNSQITGNHPVTNTLSRTIDMAAHFQSWIDLGIINNPQGNQQSRFTGSSRLYEISFTLEGFGGDGGSSGRGEVRDLCVAYSGQTVRLCTWNGCTNCGSSSSTPSISIDRSGTWEFTERDVGYTTAPTARSVTVTNTGTVPTGALTVALSGTGASAFALSATSLTSITGAGSTRSFTVQPQLGLAAGTYTATVTVSGTGLTSRSFNVSFTVNPAVVVPTFGISLSQTGTLTFPSAIAGYGEQTWVPITVTNTGNQPTGALTVTAPAGFTISGTTGMTSGIAVGATRIFEIRPSRGLAAGTYTGTVTVTGANGISRSFPVSFTVTAASTFGVSLSPSSTINFPSANVGYSQPEASTVTITNTGNQATGALNIALSGTNASSFTLSRNTVPTMTAGSTATFTVRPNTGLPAGTYTATVTVSGGNGISSTLTLNFAVSAAPTFGVTLSPTGTVTFPSADVGYSERDASTVTITNTGNQATGALNIALSGANASSFTLSRNTVPTITAGANATFTVRPNTGLPAGTYTATVTVSGGNSISQTLNVSFVVTPAPTFGVTLSPSSTITFPYAYVGYSERDASTVTVTNTGTQATGVLSVALSGTNASSFTLSRNTVPTITAGANATFTVRPNTGLAAGTYTATVTVSGGNGISQTLNVSFIVATPASTDGYFFHSTFEEDKGLDGWSGRVGTAQLSNVSPFKGTQSLSVQNRTMAWHGAVRQLDSTVFVPGNEYSFSVFAIYLEGGEDIETFALTLMYTDTAGDTRFSRIAEAAAQRGQYVQLENRNYTIPEGASNLQLIVESLQGSFSFYMDEAIGATAGTVIKYELFISDVSILSGDGWIEITNPANTAISTRGLFLTNTDDDLFLWQMPVVVIEADGTIRIRTDSNDNNGLKRMRANFDLSEGETIRLTVATDVLLSSFLIEGAAELSTPAEYMQSVGQLLANNASVTAVIAPSAVNRLDFLQLTKHGNKIWYKKRVDFVERVCYNTKIYNKFVGGSSL
jgi:uncharacterized membrane protein